MTREEAIEILATALGVPLGVPEPSYFEVKQEFWNMVGSVFDYLGQVDLFREAVQLNIHRAERAASDPEFQKEMIKAHLQRTRRIKGW